MPYRKIRYSKVQQAEEKIFKHPKYIRGLTMSRSKDIEPMYKGKGEKTLMRFGIMNMVERGDLKRVGRGLLRRTNP